MGTKELCFLTIWCLGMVVLCRGGSIEDDVEIEARLKTLNKPAVKTFERGGFIIDCVDFYKQPAFDNPLLKDHTIPRGVDEIISMRSKDKHLLGVNQTEGFEGCPGGTVPIQRVTRQDLLREKSLHDLHLNLVDPSSRDNPDYHAANLLFYGRNLTGTRAEVGLHSPRCKGNQTTGSFIHLLDDFNRTTDNIIAGWAIYPQLYRGDLRPRTTVYWGNKAQGKGCFNTICPGFVQVDAKVVLGDYFVNTSHHNGRQYETHTEIHQDNQTKHWWFIKDLKKVGYWPKELFSNLDGGAGAVLIGGVAIGDENHVAPQMGFGTYPTRSLNQSGYTRRIMFAVTSEDAYDPDVSLRDVNRIKNCFGYTNLGNYLTDRLTILFGGPGGATCR